jgi:hypothetical protein
MNTFLVTKIPSAPQSGPLSKPYQPSRAEMAKFERSYIAVSNPLSIINDALKGTITKDAIDAVNTVYPSIMKEIQERAIEQMSGAKDHLHNLPMKKKIGLSALLGHDLFNGIAQQNLMSNQMSLMAPGSQQAMNQAETGAKMNQAGMSKITIAQRSMDDRSATENRKLS